MHPSLIAPISTFGLALLSSRLDPTAIAVLAFIVVFPCMLSVLAISAVVRWIWHRLRPAPPESTGMLWRRFHWAVIGIGGLAWLSLTVIGVRAPAGPDPEISAVANLRTINTAQVTYLSAHGGKYGTIPDLIAAGLLDSRFEGSISGYVFQVILSERDYIATAMPDSPEAGDYGFYSNGDALVRYAETATGACTPCFPEGMSGSPIP